MSFRRRSASETSRDQAPGLVADTLYKKDNGNIYQRKDGRKTKALFFHSPNLIRLSWGKVLADMGKIERVHPGLLIIIRSIPIGRGSMLQ